MAFIDIGKEFKLGGQGIGTKPGYGSVGELLSALLPNVYILAGLILFFLVFMGGFSILTAAGNPEKIKEGTKTLTMALAGFLLIFVSYMLIQLIEVLTGIKIFNPGF
jgi:uncharacterized membrane protein YjfL (UPF0719 family)